MVPDLTEDRARPTLKLEARLQLERIEWLLIPPAAGKRRLFGDGRGGDGTLQRGRIRRLLKARSSRVPPIVETHENWLEQHRYLNMDDLREHKKEALRRAA